SKAVEQRGDEVRRVVTYRLGAEAVGNEDLYLIRLRRQQIEACRRQSSAALGRAEVRFFCLRLGGDLAQWCQGAQLVETQLGVDGLAADALVHLALPRRDVDGARACIMEAVRGRRGGDEFVKFRLRRAKDARVAPVRAAHDLAVLFREDAALQPPG